VGVFAIPIKAKSRQSGLPLASSKVDRLQSTQGIICFFLLLIHICENSILQNIISQNNVKLIKKSLY
jgi:hypothetical protein